MLIKIQDGFYLNSQHIIAVSVQRLAVVGDFEITIQYSLHDPHQANEIKRRFATQRDAETFLQELNQKIQ